MSAIELRCSEANTEYYVPSLLKVSWFSLKCSRLTFLATDHTCMDGERAFPIARNRGECALKKHGTAAVCSVWHEPGTIAMLSSYSPLSIVLVCCCEEIAPKWSKRLSRAAEAVRFATASSAQKLGREALS
jgi:hypothetical protein